MTVTVTNTAGPFEVTAQNSSPTVWQGGTPQTVTWSVANTNLPPVGTSNVNILLSTDGGQTFPTVLVSNTANDGSEQITVPNLPTTTARLKVEAVGNIYFDISNVNFTITGATVSSATIAGRVTRSNGQGVSNAIVSLVDAGVGGRRYALTNPFGYYQFVGVPTGSSYTVAVVSRLYTFTPQTIQVNGDLTEVNFVANEQ